MSIFTKILVLFSISIVLMLFLSNKANKINNEKTEQIHKHKYLLASKELFEHLVNGDLVTLDKTMHKLEYEEIDTNLILQDLIMIYERTISFGEIKIFKQKNNTYLLFMKYLDDQFYFYDLSQDKELEQKEHLNYLIGVDIVILIIMFLVILNILKPLKLISKGLNKFGAGDYSSRLQVTKSNDEIGDVVDKFNNMAQNLESLIISRTQFLSDISHELRTPISKAKLSLEMIEASKYKTILKKSIDNIDALTNELLELERLNSNTITLNIQKYSIETVLANALDKMIIDDEEDIEVKIIDLFDCDVDINYISIAIKNLIDNALKYKESGKVKIIVENQSIEVKNYGIRLNKDLAFYMQTFTQEDNSRNIQGYGLGLNIVKRVLAHHNFDLKYDYKESQNIFKIVFNESTLT